MSSDVEAQEAAPEARTVSESLRSLVDDLRESASVESVYGEPLTTQGKTVVPVARVAYGFGGGTGPPAESAEGAGGMGGGVAATPAGALEITDGDTRFVRFDDRRRMGAVLAVGLLLGLLIGRRRSSR